MRSAKVTYRFIIFLLATIFSIIFCAPSFFNLNFGHKINLGLDLQGGLHMLLGVDVQKAVSSKIKSIAASVNYSIKKDDLLIEDFKIEDSGFEFKILDQDETPKFDSILSEIPGISVDKKSLLYIISLTPKEIENTKKYAVEQAIETIRNRLDQFGLAEPTVARQDKSEILVEIPGVKTQADENRAKELIAKAANLELMEVDDRHQDEVNSLTPEEAKSYGDIIATSIKNPKQKFLLKELPILDGSMLIDAKVGFNDKTNQAVINFTLNSQGSKIFGDFTGNNVGKRLAIVLDGKVYSAPRINERIGGGSGQISGDFTIEEANDLAIALRSGALLAPVKVLEKRSVGPSLGQDSIKQSLKALILASVLIVVFMIAYYGVAGIFADIALVVNILFLVACMALFDATLTLPGMAGIVLTVGMAVDANVIINERIREMLDLGCDIKKAITKGYENAMSAIIDANLTTLITSAVLYAYGTGPVKGFAVTMSIGIIASMITAILGTHSMFELYWDKLNKNASTKKWFGYVVKGVKKNANIW